MIIAKKGMLIAIRKTQQRMSQHSPQIKVHKIRATLLGLSKRMYDPTLRGDLFNIALCN